MFNENKTQNVHNILVNDELKLKGVNKILTSNEYKNQIKITGNTKNTLKIPEENVVKDTNKANVVDKNLKKNDTATESSDNLPTEKKRIESMTDDEIIQENLKELLEKKSRDERRANGRFVAIIIAFLVIFLAIYHAWIRKTAGLAGILLPAVIMLTYGSWIVILAKRDKQKRAMFQKHLEEVALKNKSELEERAKAKKAKRKSERKENAKTKEATLHFENEIQAQHNKASSNSNTKMTNGSNETHRKHRDRQRSDGVTTDSDISDPNNSEGCGSTTTTLTTATSTSKSKYNDSCKNNTSREICTQKASILVHQKFLKPNAIVTHTLPVPGTAVKVTTSIQQPELQIEQQQLRQKKKRLERINAISMPQMVRMSSAP